MIKCFNIDQSNVESYKFNFNDSETFYIENKYFGSKNKPFSNVNFFAGTSDKIFGCCLVRGDLSCSVVESLDQLNLIIQEEMEILEEINKNINKKIFNQDYIENNKNNSNYFYDNKNITFQRVINNYKLIEKYQLKKIKNIFVKKKVFTDKYTNKMNRSNRLNLGIVNRSEDQTNFYVFSNLTESGNFNDVLVLEKNLSTGVLTVKLTFKEMKINSGFGKSILLADLNRDGLEDLIISSPSYRDKFFKEGLVNVYFSHFQIGLTNKTLPLIVSNNKINENEDDKNNKNKCENVEGRENNKRKCEKMEKFFGYKLFSLGDLDFDGFNDFGVLELWIASQKSQSQTNKSQDFFSSDNNLKFKEIQKQFLYIFNGNNNLDYLTKQSQVVSLEVENNHNNINLKNISDFFINEDDKTNYTKNYFLNKNLNNDKILIIINKTVYLLETKKIIDIFHKFHQPFPSIDMQTNEDENNFGGGENGQKADGAEEVWFNLTLCFSYSIRGLINPYHSLEDIYLNYSLQLSDEKTNQNKNNEYNFQLHHLFHQEDDKTNFSYNNEHRAYFTIDNLDRKTNKQIKKYVREFHKILKIKMNPLGLDSSNCQPLFIFINPHIKDVQTSLRLDLNYKVLHQEISSTIFSPLLTSFSFFPSNQLNFLSHFSHLSSHPLLNFVFSFLYKDFTEVSKKKSFDSFIIYHDNFKLNNLDNYFNKNNNIDDKNKNMINKYEDNHVKKAFHLIPFSKDCPSRCISNLRVIGLFELFRDSRGSNLIEVPEDSPPVKLIIQVMNNNDDAFNSFLFVHLPPLLHFVGSDKKICKTKDPTLLVCFLGNPFKKHSLTTLAIFLGISEAPLDIGLPPLSVRFYANSTSHEKDLDDNEESLNLKTSTRPSLHLIETSIPLNVTMENNQSPLLLSYHYQIENIGQNKSPKLKLKLFSFVAENKKIKTKLNEDIDHGIISSIKLSHKNCYFGKKKEDYENEEEEEEEEEEEYNEYFVKKIKKGKNIFKKIENSHENEKGEEIIGVDDGWPGGDWLEVRCPLLSIRPLQTLYFNFTITCDFKKETSFKYKISNLLKVFGEEYNENLIITKSETFLTISSNKLDSKMILMFFLLVSFLLLFVLLSILVLFSFFFLFSSFYEKFYKKKKKKMFPKK